MNYKDVALLNQSFGNLQDSILRSRMLEQNKQEHTQDQAFRERELDTRVKEQSDASAARKEQYDAEKQHWKNIEESTKLHATMQQVGQASKDLQQSIVSLGEMAKEKDEKGNPKYTNEQITDYFKGSLDAIGNPDVQAQLQNSPQIKLLTSGNFDWSAAGTKSQGQTAKERDAKTYQELIQKAAEAESSGDTDTAQRLRGAAEILNKQPRDKSTIQIRPDPNNPGQSITNRTDTTFLPPGSQSSRPPTTSKALPMPKTKQELKKGETYSTSRGPAVWNGSAFQRVD